MEVQMAASHVSGLLMLLTSLIFSGDWSDSQLPLLVVCSDEVPDRIDLAVSLDAQGKLSCGIRFSMNDSSWPAYLSSFPKTYRVKCFFSLDGITLRDPVVWQKLILVAWQAIKCNRRVCIYLPLSTPLESRQP
jgi:hypothetical protein